MMDSCRRTGLSGVLCSLSLLCVLLDIQLDGRANFYLLLEVSQSIRTPFYFHLFAVPAY